MSGTTTRETTVEQRAESGNQKMGFSKGRSINWPFGGTEVVLRGSTTTYFPPSRDRSARAMSENTINAALRYMGYGKEVMTGHGFRAMARTILDEVLGERPDLIEHQLAHTVRDPLGRAYNRTSHLPARRAMMQRWADYLSKLRMGADVIPIHDGAA